jgi:hypothetical protein
VSRRVPDAPGVGVLSRVRSLTLGSVLAISALAGLPAIGSAAICPAAKKGEKVVQSKQVRKTTCAVTSAVVAWRVGVRFQPDSAAAGGAVAGGAAAGSFCG